MNRSMYYKKEYKRDIDEILEQCQNEELKKVIVDYVTSMIRTSDFVLKVRLLSSFLSPEVAEYEISSIRGLSVWRLNVFAKVSNMDIGNVVSEGISAGLILPHVEDLSIQKTERDATLKLFEYLTSVRQQYESIFSSSPSDVKKQMLSLQKTELNLIILKAMRLVDSELDAQRVRMAYEHGTKTNEFYQGISLPLPDETYISQAEHIFLQKSLHL